MPNQDLEASDDRKLKREAIFDSSPNVPGNPLCFSTGVFVSADKRYRITVTRLPDLGPSTALGKWSFWVKNPLWAANRSHACRPQRVSFWHCCSRYEEI